jgi:zinc transport system substrate-binding protein/manganese/iron transport system substrate-binding protein
MNSRFSPSFTSRQRSRVARTLLLLALTVLVGGWGVAQVRVVASIHPYYDLLRQLGGERVVVVRLLPPGASPHTFDPSPRDVAAVTEADLIVINGVLDAWLDDLIAASGSDAEVIVMLSTLDLEPIAGEAHDHDHDGDRPDGSGEEVDPHIWLDPLLMVEAIGLFADRLAALDPAGAEHYAGRAARLSREIVALDAELQALLAPVVGAPFVPFHGAWSYFVAHYGLDLVVEIEPFPGREPSPAYLARALTLIADAGAQAVFSERQLGQRPAEVVAESAGVALITLDPLGGGEGTESYQEMLRYNARMIADALAPRDDR